MPCAPFGCGSGEGCGRRVWATVAVTGAIAIVVAMVVAVVAGARRTATAPDRYTASVGGNVDGLVEQRSGQPLTDRIAALPGVKQVAAYTFVFGGLESAQHKVPDTLITFAGGRPLTSRVVAGRDPNPNDPHEFVADKSFTKATGARVGDRFAFQSISRAQIASGQGFGGKPEGAAFAATLVGVISSPDEINSDFTVAIFPTALLREDVGFVATVMQVRLRPGFSASDLRRELDTLPNRAALSLEPGVVISGDIRNAVEAQATGLWVLVAVLAVAALVALGPAPDAARAARRSRARRAAVGRLHAPPAGDREPVGRGGAGARRPGGRRRAGRRPIRRVPDRVCARARTARRDRVSTWSRSRAARACSCSVSSSG